MFEELLPNEHTANTKSHASNTHVSYKPTLIPVLLHEHQILLSLCSDTLEAAKMGNSDLSKQNLSKLHDVFSWHLIKKRYALYIYLNQLLEDDNASVRASLVKSEMYRIGKELHVLSSLYAKGQRGINKVFIEKFEILGKSLAKQIKNEESHLFPAYQAACLINA